MGVGLRAYAAGADDASWGRYEIVGRDYHSGGIVAHSHIMGCRDM